MQEADSCLVSAEQVVSFYTHHGTPCLEALYILSRLAGHSKGGHLIGKREQDDADILVSHALPGSSTRYWVVSQPYQRGLRRALAIAWEEGAASCLKMFRIPVAVKCYERFYRISTTIDSHFPSADVETLERQGHSTAHAERQGQSTAHAELLPVEVGHIRQTSENDLDGWSCVALIMIALIVVFPLQLIVMNRSLHMA